MEARTALRAVEEGLLSLLRDQLLLVGKLSVQLLLSELCVQLLLLLADLLVEPPLLLV